MQYRAGAVLLPLALSGAASSSIVPINNFISQAQPGQAPFWRLAFPFLLFDWFLLVSLLSILASRHALAPRSLYRVVRWSGAVVAPFVGYAAVADVVHVGRACISCWLAYLAALGVLEVSARCLRALEPTRPVAEPASNDASVVPATHRRSVTLGLAGFLLLSSALFGIVLRRAPHDDNPGLLTGAAFDKWWLRQPRVTLPSSLNDTPADLVRVVVFTDYLCPACSLAFTLHRQFEASFPARMPQVRLDIVVKDVPLSTACNKQITVDLHPLACDAAVAVRLARRSGDSRSLEEWIYMNQKGLTRDVLWAAARRLSGVAPTDNDYALAIAGVATDIELASTLGIRALPAVLVNNVRVRGLLSLQQLERATDLELSRLR